MKFMKIFTYKTFLFISLFLIFSNNPIFGQVKFDPFQVKSSTLFEDLLKLKSENPKITATDLAERANALLRKKGMNFVFAFDQNLCQKISDARQKQKDKTQPVKLNATLKSVDGEVARIMLPDISFDKSECGRCFIQMPLFEFSGKTFVTSIQDRNINFFTPPDLLFNEVVLVDNQNTTSEIRRWQVPFRALPIGISDDGKLLYLELPHKELNELALIIYDEGGFQFYAKKDLDLSAKPSESKGVPNADFIKFTRDEKIHILKYTISCQ